ncbi:MAG: DUF3606 domain-containing protein [Burkholderiaceae bacterium]
MEQWSSAPSVGRAAVSLSAVVERRGPDGRALSCGSENRALIPPVNLTRDSDRPFATLRHHRGFESRRQEMAEHATPHAALAEKRIDIDNPDQMSVWSRELAIPESRLREVIDMIGPMTAAIRFYVASPKFRMQ